MLKKYFIQEHENILKNKVRDKSRIKEKNH